MVVLLGTVTLAGEKNSSNDGNSGIGRNDYSVAGNSMSEIYLFRKIMRWRRYDW